MNKLFGTLLLSVGVVLSSTSCDSNNSMVDGEERSPGAGSFAVSPARVSLETGDQTTVLRIIGGQTPMTWSVSDTNLGTIPDTDGRTITYTRTPGREGVNIVEVRDSNGNSAQAQINQQSLTLSPAVAVLSPGVETATFTVTGGSEPFSWSVSDTRYGSLASTRGRSNVYIQNPTRTNVLNTVTVRDGSGDLSQAVINQ